MVVATVVVVLLVVVALLLFGEEHSPGRHAAVRVSHAPPADLPARAGR